jgi:hypothetical protein
VRAFLSASASYAVDPGAARQFLVPALRAKWHPGPVTVVSSINSQPPPPHNLGPTGTPGEAIVKFSGQQLATLSRDGQYQYLPGTQSYSFSLIQVGDEWLISALPPAEQDSLLLTQFDFEHVYQARNLFFFARPPSPANGKLIPDPVYAPLQSSDSALNTNLASRLVNGLLNDQDTWVSSATKTYFPRGTHLLGITISGQTAYVNLGGSAVRTGPTQRQAMLEQLRATLSSTAYSAALAPAVVLKINGHLFAQGKLPDLVYKFPEGPLVYGDGEYIVSQATKTTKQIAGPVQFNPADTSALAIAPAGSPRAGQLAVAAKYLGGCRVYLPPVSAGTGQPTQPWISHLLSTSGGPCTSLSWDSNGNLWVAEGRNIWVLRASDGKWQSVGAPANPATGLHPEILALRMAPDAVRAALLIKTKAGAILVLAAVQDDHGQLSLGTSVDVGTGLPQPTAMSWYNPYDLVVLDASGIAEVPLTGGVGQLIGPAPPGAVSLTTNGKTLAVGTHNKIWTSPALGSPWSSHETGSLPIYQG